MHPNRRATSRKAPADPHGSKDDQAPAPTFALPAQIEAGYRRFRAGRFALERERYRELGEGIQRPATMVVACSDSRSAPETILDAGPGELFVVRNVAALVPAHAPDGRAHAASAALEYAVVILGVTTLMVMGHGRCGGIAAVIDDKGPRPTEFIGAWVAGIRDLLPATDGSAGEDPRGTDPEATRLALERTVVEHSVANLRTFPWIRSREASGALRLVGAWFDIALGELHVLDPTGWTRVADTD